MTKQEKSLIKLMEECGEVSQIAAKKLAFMETDQHPDGKGSMKLRLQDEIADVLACCALVIENLNLDEERIKQRSLSKIQFLKVP